MFDRTDTTEKTWEEKVAGGIVVSQNEATAL
jgi:hypothetical protein